MGNNNGKPVLRDEDIVILCRTSGLSQEQVRNGFENFIKEHPDGKMKPKDFGEMMNKALPGKGAGKMKKHVLRMFESDSQGCMIKYHSL